MQKFQFQIEKENFFNDSGVFSLPTPAPQLLSAIFSNMLSAVLRAGVTAILTLQLLNQFQQGGIRAMSFELQIWTLYVVCVCACMRLGRKGTLFFGVSFSCLNPNNTPNIFSSANASHIIYSILSILSVIFGDSRELRILKNSFFTTVVLPYTLVRRWIEGRTRKVSYEK